MEVSFFLARLFGVYLIISALAVMVNKDRYKDAYKELKRDKLQTHVMGSLALVIGLLVVGFHNVWVGWPILITIIGWSAILKGSMILIAPDLMIKFSKDMGWNDSMHLYGFAGLIIGAFLLYIGFFV